MEMTKNQYQEYVKKCASRWHNEAGYTKEKFDADINAVKILPLDLSKFLCLSDRSISWINKLFTEETTDRDGNYMLRGFTYREMSEVIALKCKYGEYAQGLNFFAYNEEECFIYTYCEGDTTITLFPDRESYKAAYRKTLKWYSENAA